MLLKIQIIVANVEIEKKAVPVDLPETSENQRAFGRREEIIG